MIIYQVYPRSFSDGNNDGLGDLKGLSQKLPYLAELGVDTIWVSPFFKSPMKDFGYDVSDYCDVDPIFGTMSDIDQIIALGNKFGIRIMIDMVLSHSSDQHPWFTESRKDRKNPKADWYVWADAREDGSPPNNWISLFGGTAWQWDTRRGQYYLHNFLKEQPDFNFHEPQVRQALLDACEFWLKKGIRGFRLDVCNFYYHSAGLENNPAKATSEKNTEGVHSGNPYNFQKHVYDKDQNENVDFLKSLRVLADKYPGTQLMGEVVSDDSLGVMKNYIFKGSPLHTAYNFSLFKPQLGGKVLAEIIEEFESRVGDSKPTWALGNHDVPRFTSRLNQQYPHGSKLYLTILFCLKGNIVLYQGDELGLDEVEIPFELMQDPFGIEFYPEFKGRDGCRTPIPWSAEKPAHKTWLPIPQSHLQKSVDVQGNDSNSVLQFTKRLIQFRKKFSWLETADVKVLFSDECTLVIERSNSESILVAAFNFGDSPQNIELPFGHEKVNAVSASIWVKQENQFNKVLDSSLGE